MRKMAMFGTTDRTFGKCGAGLGRVWNHEKLERLIAKCRQIDLNEPFFRSIERAFEKDVDLEKIPTDAEVGKLSKQMAEKAAQIGADLWRQRNIGKPLNYFGTSLLHSTISDILDELGCELIASLGRYKDALDAAQRAISIDPLNAFVKQVVVRSSNPR